MPDEPEKFFVGVIDFFAVLLPGALLVYALQGIVPDTSLRLYVDVTGVQGWAVFLVASYLVGHFIFLLGAWILDDYLYDPIRDATYRRQIERLSVGKNLSPIWQRWIAKHSFKKETDPALARAKLLMEHYLEPLRATSAMNAFQWCKARLTMEQPQALATVERWEADSKFFRSLFVVIWLVAPILAGRMGKGSLPILVPATLLLLAFAFYRYLERRGKAINQAYWFVIALEACDKDGYREPPNAPARDPSHAGGVVFRRKRGQVEYLLVQAKLDPQEWVLPKGHIKPGEDMRQTAVREVREETGVWAKVRSSLKRVSFTACGAQVTTQYYLMQAAGKAEPEDKNRKSAWHSLSDAASLVRHQESKDLLRSADQVLRKAQGTAAACSS
jgi:ADP-ribose pyrophosphatase YjhB (NUDIX family)